MYMIKFSSHLILIETETWTVCRLAVKAVRISCLSCTQATPKIRLQLFVIQYLQVDIK